MVEFLFNVAATKHQYFWHRKKILHEIKLMSTISVPTHQQKGNSPRPPPWNPHFPVRCAGDSAFWEMRKKLKQHTTLCLFNFSWSLHLWWGLRLIHIWQKWFMWWELGLSCSVNFKIKIWKCWLNCSWWCLRCLSMLLMNNFEFRNWV